MDDQMDQVALRLLENDFEEILRQLFQDQKFLEFQHHYENMLQTLRESHSKEKELHKNCQQLKDTIEQNACKIKTVIQIAQKDSENITYLKKELNDAKNLLIIQKEKDEVCKQKIESLTKMWKNLEIITKQNQDLNYEKLQRFQQIMQEQKTLERDKKQINQVLADLERQNKEEQEKLKLSIQLKSQQEDTNQQLEQMNSQVVDQKEKNLERYQQTHQEYQNIQKEVLMLRNTQNEEKNSLQKLKKEDQKIQAITKALKVQKENMQQIICEFELEISQQKNEIEQIKNLINIEQNEKTKVEEIHKEKQKEYNKIRLKQDQSKRNVDKLNSELKKIKSEKTSLKQNKILINNQFANNNQKLKQLEIDTQAIKQKMILMLQDYENTKKQFKDFQADNKQNLEEIRVQIKQAEELEEQIEPLKQQLEQLQEKERQLTINIQQDMKKASRFKQIQLEVTEKVMLMDHEISEMQAKERQQEKYLSEKQKLYETFKVERNQMTKFLKDQEDEINDFKAKLNIIQKENHQLSQETNAKQQYLQYQVMRTEDFQKSFRKLQNLIRDLQGRRQRKAKLAKTYGNEIHALEQQNLNQRNVVENMQIQQKSVLKERDTLLAHLIQKNDEIQILKNKLAFQEETLLKGQKQFFQKQDQKNFLNIIFRELISEYKTSKIKVSKVFNYQKKIEETQQKLVQEDLKVKALGEELEDPKNKYRWRSIEGHEVEKYELVEKIQALQKKIINKAQQAISENLKIKSQKQQMKEYDLIIKESPGFEESKELLLIQKSYQKKIRKLKSTVAELNLYKFKTNETHILIDNFKENIQRYQKKFFRVLIGKKQHNKILKLRNQFQLKTINQF